MTGRRSNQLNYAPRDGGQSSRAPNWKELDDQARLDPARIHRADGDQRFQARPDRDGAFARSGSRSARSVGAREAPRFLSGSVENHYSALVGLGRGIHRRGSARRRVGGMIGSFTRTGLHLHAAAADARLARRARRGRALRARCSCGSSAPSRFRFRASRRSTHGLRSRTCCGGWTRSRRRTTSCGSRSSSARRASRARRSAAGTAPRCRRRRSGPRASSSSSRAFAIPTSAASAPALLECASGALPGR